MDPAQLLPILLASAWLLPLASFTLIVLFGPRMGKAGVLASYVATGAIVSSCVLSLIAFGVWHLGSDKSDSHGTAAHSAAAHASAAPHAQADQLPTASSASNTVSGSNSTAGAIQLASFRAADSHAASDGHAADDHHHHGGGLGPSRVYSGEWYTLGVFGKLQASVGYYIDSLTILMFAMVTFIASCIHFYAIGYMHDELHDITDHEVTLSNGKHLHRPGRFHRFFQYLSLFCFSMLGLVIAGNVLMVFMFWELVGICSFFLIGFYIERKSASTAANKAFIVNRVGDFGMIIGLMALWGSLGTFGYGEIFDQVRPESNGYQLQVPDGMVLASAQERVAQIAGDHRLDPEGARLQAAAEVEQLREVKLPDGRGKYGYLLLTIAGLGIFCGCVGKSAQFPLHVWLPDAMEGPTPVSALVHSATMVAAGVYLAGRFYPVFTPEALLVIAYTGGITLFIAATIALTASDIKRVLAYSTVSQLGYMMLSLGIGGWAAALFHLVTHAFFKSLLFMCSGSVIHACHTNDMFKMGGLIRKMPWTGYTMLIGCLAIIGTVGFSGYFSKDAIIAQAMSFMSVNSSHGTILFALAAGGATLTAFYMFRLWFLTFIGEPRDHHVYDHAHESPKVMYVPLVILSLFAIGAGWPIPVIGVVDMLEAARPAGVMARVEDPLTGVLIPELVYPAEHVNHDFHTQAMMVAFLTALAGVLLAAVLYAWRLIDPADVKAQFPRLYRFLWNKWYFDELYNAIFVQPTHALARMASRFDRQVIDGAIDRSARWTLGVSKVDDAIDRYLVDGLVNLIARWTYAFGNWLRGMQTGRLRQYVMFVVVGTVALTVVIRWAMGMGP